MYCINCGVKLADTEKKCPLCETAVYHPDLQQGDARPLYPKGKMPKSPGGSAALNGAVLFLFFIPILVCFFADLWLDGKIEWFGYVAGAMLLAYVALGLPRWFRRPNPVVFVPCTFAALALYLFYIDFATDGAWFFPFALPLVAGICVIVTTVITLVRYVRRGRLYIFGGAFIALGVFMLPVELLMEMTLSLPFMGWSTYPLAVLVLFGGLCIYLAINSDAREMIERKLFF